MFSLPFQNFDCPIRPYNSIVLSHSLYVVGLKDDLSASDHSVWQQVKASVSAFHVVYVRSEFAQDCCVQISINTILRLGQKSL